MLPPKVLTVSTETEIVKLRMSVRDMARTLGMSPSDQARISLAASSLMEAVNVSATNEAEVTVQEYHVNGKTGARVVCVVGNDHLEQRMGAFRDLKWLVDELTIETLASGKVQIVLTRLKA